MNNCDGMNRMDPTVQLRDLASSRILYAAHSSRVLVAIAVQCFNHILKLTTKLNVPDNKLDRFRIWYRG